MTYTTKNKKPRPVVKAMVTIPEQELDRVLPDVLMAYRQKYTEKKRGRSPKRNYPANYPVCVRLNILERRAVIEARNLAGEKQTGTFVRRILLEYLNARGVDTTKP